MPLAEARAITRQVVANCKAASDATGRDFVIINRSDSTLRGHYPGEVDALIEALEQRSAAQDRPVDGVLFIPFFFEGGRITINDTHYVTDGDDLIPAGETEYARDAANRTQVILTTHSPEFLDAFGQEAPATTVVEWRNGETELRVLSGEDLSYWLKEYTLGELYRSKELEAME